MKEFLIGDRCIGESEPPLVIAEVGINHGGEIGKAIECIDAAAAAGAECVKFQSHITEAEMLPVGITPRGISDEPLWDIMRRCQLTAAEERALKEYCETKGVIYLCTPFSREAADRLEDMDIAAFKIGSGECNNLPLLRHVARKGRPIILSTGMNDLSSVRQSVEVIQELGCPVMLMHCTSEYPTPYEHVRLGAIQQLMTEFDVPVGMSDHSIGIYTCLGAVGVGAVALEKHFTVSRDWPGPDVHLSIDPGELRQLVEGAGAVWSARGGSKTILPTEQPVIDFAYACVVTIQDVREGEVLSLRNIWVKRPGTGAIQAKDLESVLGRRASRDILKNTQLAPEDFR